MAHTVLVVPVPALEDYIRGRWEHYDAAWVSRDPAFTHAHITALAPFRPAPTDADLARVARIARTTPAFDLVLDEVTAFPDGIVHIVPSNVSNASARHNAACGVRTRNATSSDRCKGDIASHASRCGRPLRSGSGRRG